MAEESEVADGGRGEAAQAGIRERPCPCGSGRRYLECHGVPGSRQAAPAGSRRSAAELQRVDDSAPSATSSANLLEVEAFSAFYRENLPRLIAHLRWRGVPLVDAVDCVQDAMLKALPPRFATLTDPYSWCRTTALYMYLRRLSDSAEHPVSDVGIIGSPLIRRDADLQELEQRHYLLPLLDKLTPKQRQLMTLAIDGAKPADIAAELNEPVDRVQSSLKNARKKMAELLEQVEGGAR